MGKTCNLLWTPPLLKKGNSKNNPVHIILTVLMLTESEEAEKKRVMILAEKKNHLEIINTATNQTWGDCDFNYSDSSRPLRLWMIPTPVPTPTMLIFWFYENDYKNSDFNISTHVDPNSNWAHKFWMFTISFEWIQATIHARKYMLFDIETWSL